MTTRTYQSGPGTGLPLVLLHGFCEDASVWHNLVEMLEDIRIVRMDLPGFGGTPLTEPTAMAGYAEAVRKALDELAVETCVLVGHSLGGYVALEFATQYADRLAGLGLFHSHPFADKPETKANRQRGIELIQSGRKDAYVAQLFPGLFTPAFAEAHPHVLEELIFKGQQLSEEAIVNALQAMMNRQDRLDTLRHLNCPVQFVLGESDTLVPKEPTLQAAAQTALADIHLLPGVAHMAMFEAPEQAKQALHTFWKFCAER